MAASDDLFTNALDGGRHAPLAERMRPRSLEEFAGQRHLMEASSFLRQAIDADRVPSLILWGPPGVGKTTLARLMAARSGSRFVALSATQSGLKDVKEAAEAAVQALAQHQRRTLLFVDEIHRFNKTQQDAFLPFVENGTLTLVGATTENPSFEVNAALLSRARVVRLEPLAEAELCELLKRALNDVERGLGDLSLSADDEALTLLASLAGGDARRALGSLEQAAQMTKAEGADRLTLDAIKKAASRGALLYDKRGDQHYDLISALHKSVRSSDPQGAIYWATRMLSSGENPLYVVRRIVRMASEDIGNADPYALRVCLDAKEAYEFLGSPEGEMAILQAVAYLACSPKSDASEQAYNSARRELESTGHPPVPMHLRNAPTKLMKELGAGEGYQHAHDQPDAVVDMTTLPPELKTKVFYKPFARGKEKVFKDYLEWVEERKKAKRTKE